MKQEVELVQPMQVLLSRTQKVTQEKISEFHESFGGSNPIHTDAVAAETSGHGATLQHAARTIYPIYAMLVERHQDGFLKGGALNAKFIAPVAPGDVITCYCRLIGRRSDSKGGAQLEFEIGATNQRDTTVLVGMALVREVE